MNPILNSLKSRLAWYEKALAMATGFSPRENGFNWPQAPGIVSPPREDDFDWLSQYIMYLSGCINELHNTIDMLTAKEETKP